MSYLDEQLKLVFRALPVSLAGTIVSSLVLAYFLADIIPHSSLYIWLACVAGITLFRAGLFVAYHRASSPNFNTLAQLFNFGALLAGCGWGAVSLWLFPAESLPHQILVAFGIAGVIAAGAVSLAALWQSFMLFMPPTLLPLMYKLWLVSGETSVAMILVIVIFMLVMIKNTRSSYLSTLQNIQLREKELEAEKAIQATQSELEESRHMLSLILDTVPVSIYWKDVHGTYLGCNKAFTKELALEQEAIIGKTNEELPTAVQKMLFHANEQRILQTGDPVLNQEQHIVLGNGKLRWVNYSLIPLSDHAGKIIGILGANYDVTGQKRVEEIKNEFISTVSHELRTPLTSIRGAIGLLHSSKAPDKKKFTELMDIAYNNTDRLLHLIDDLLTIQKIESVYMDFSMAPVKLDELVPKVLQDNLSLAEHYEVHFVLEKNDKNTQIQGDAQRLTQVITNLISNAAKFSHPGQQVELGVIREGKQCFIYVQDHGVGIPKEFHSRLFERFTQWDASNTREIGGTGLGLNIVKSIVERHQGSIRFESEEGQGTRFEVCLPAIETQQRAEPVF